MNEQNKDDANYVLAAVKACSRRLALLEDAFNRGVHTEEEYKHLRGEIIRETEQAWDVSLGEFL